MTKKLSRTKKKITLTFLSLISVICLHAQNGETENAWMGEVKAGIRLQKAQKLYWENGFVVDFSSPKILDSRVHIGVSYITSRLGSARGTNAIKQDNYLLNLGYHFRHQKKLQPFARLNLGYFSADYEYAIFDVLPNTAFLFSIEAGISYEFEFPITLNISTGYNLNTGNGIDGPGTLYPVFYQMSIFYTLIRKK